MIHQYTKTLTVSSGGDLTTYIGQNINGRVHAIKYAAGTLDAGTDLAITGETTGVAILTDSPAASEWFYPRAFPNAATTGAAGTVASEPIILCKERIKVVVAQGGTSMTGTITIYVDE